MKRNSKTVKCPLHRHMMVKRLAFKITIQNEVVGKSFMNVSLSSIKLATIT